MLTLLDEVLDTVFECQVSLIVFDLFWECFEFAEARKEVVGVDTDGFVDIRHGFLLLLMVRQSTPTYV